MWATKFSHDSNKANILNCPSSHWNSRLRRDLEHWINETGDQGVNPEPEEMYDSDMEVYIGNREGRELKDNIALMKKWAAEGK